MVWAEYGFSANLRLTDFAAPGTIFATHKDGELLTAEHGFPLRLVVPTCTPGRARSGSGASST